MFRIMSIATLVMIAICFVIGAGLAMADEPPVPAGPHVNDASLPAETLHEENLAQNDRDGDAYDFSDYFDKPGTAVQQPPVDSEAIEEPNLKRFEKMDC
ncbi:hypothetical protein [Dongia sp.]|uniref:hypothetical protein n=1 Tax=Dongia sp. TaxID=1977262 RepID=UPI0035B0892A